MLQLIQSLIAGIPLPDVVGNAIAVRVLPPNSPDTTPVSVPCATEMPLAPAARKDSDSVCTCEGAVQVPGEPAVNVACFRSARYTLDGEENSAGARAMPVAQSSPEESSSPPVAGIG